MRRHTYNVFSAVMYILSVVSFFALVGTDMISSLSSVWRVHQVKFITALAIFVFGFFASYLLSINEQGISKRKRIFFTTIIWLLFAYCFILFDFTLFDDTFGRSVSSVFVCSKQDLNEYLTQSTNFIPFATIRLFLKGYLTGSLPLTAFTENIFGNFAVFIPFALFLPVLSKRFYKWKSFLSVMVLCVIFIELMQFIMLTGSLDIDDLILNLSGVSLAFYLLKTKRASIIIKKATFNSGLLTQDFFKRR